MSLLFVLASLTSPSVMRPSTAVQMLQRAPTGTPLVELNDFHQMMVDRKHHQVFVTGGGTNSVVYVMSYDASVTEVIDGVPGAAGMVLDAIADRLYVAEEGYDRIDVIDTATFPPTLLEPIFVGNASPLVGSVALTNGLLWFGYGLCATWTAAIASVSISSGLVTTYSGEGLSSDYCPYVATDPEQPDLLIQWGRGLNPPTIDSFDLSTGTPVLIVSRFLNELEYLNQPVFAPGRPAFYAAPAGASDVDTIRVPDLEPVSPTCHVSQAPIEPIALSPAGTRIAVGNLDPKIVTLFRIGRACTQSGIIELADDLYREGLAYGNATRLFGVTGANAASPTFVIIVP